MKRGFSAACSQQIEKALAGPPVKPYIGGAKIEPLHPGNGEATQELAGLDEHRSSKWPSLMSIWILLTPKGACASFRLSSRGSRSAVIRGIGRSAKSNTGHATQVG